MEYRGIGVSLDFGAPRVEYRGLCLLSAIGAKSVLN